MKLWQCYKIQMRTLPPKYFAKGPKKLIAWRLPEDLLAEIEKVAKADGWNVSDIAATALDQYVHARKTRTPKRRK